MTSTVRRGGTRARTFAVALAIVAAGSTPWNAQRVAAADPSEPGPTDLVAAAAADAVTAGAAAATPLFDPVGASVLVAGDASLSGTTLDGAALVGGNVTFTAASRVNVTAPGVDAGAYGKAGLVVGGLVDLTASTTTLSIEQGANAILGTDNGDFLSGSPANHYVSRGHAADAQHQLALVSGGQVLRGAPLDIAARFAAMRAASTAMIGLGATPCATADLPSVVVVDAAAATVPAAAPFATAAQVLVINLLDRGDVTITPPTWSLTADQVARVIWNVPNATSLTIVGTTPLPGSLLAPGTAVIDRNPAWITGSVVARSLQSGDAAAVGGTIGLATADLAIGCLDRVATMPTEAPKTTVTPAPALPAGPVYDLALAVRYATSPVFIRGALLDYEIIVANQGTVASGAYSVQDTLPDGMSLVAADNGGTPVAGTISWVDLPSIAPGATATLRFTLRLQAIDRPGYRNIAEISADSGDDRDSTPDNNPFDDAVIDSDDPTIDLLGDSDDHDVTDASANQVRFDNQRLITAGADGQPAASDSRSTTAETAPPAIGAAGTPGALVIAAARPASGEASATPFATTATSATRAAPAATVITAAATLPATGGSTATLALLAGLLVAIGSALLWVRRRGDAVVVATVVG